MFFTNPFFYLSTENVTSLRKDAKEDLVKWVVGESDDTKTAPNMWQQMCPNYKRQGRDRIQKQSEKNIRPNLHERQKLWSKKQKKTGMRTHMKVREHARKGAEQMEAWLCAVCWVSNQGNKGRK